MSRRSSQSRIGRADFLRLAGAGFAGAAIFGVAGCGGSGGGSSSQGNKPLAVGGLLTLSGPFASLGESIRDGMNLFLEERSNEFSGHRVNVSYEDTQGDPQTDLRLYRQFVSKGTHVLMGTVLSPEALALAGRLERDKVILVDSNAAANDLSWSKKSDYLYRVSQSNYQTGVAGAHYIAEKIGKRAFTIGMDYVAGYEVIKAFRSAYEKAGGKVIGHAFSPPGTNDFTSYITNMKQANPDLVFAFLSGTDAIRFIQQYDSLGLKGKIPLVGTDQLGSSTVTKAAGRSAEGIISRSPYYPSLDNETNRRFVVRFKKKYSREPDLIDCQGYDTGGVIAQAVKKAGSTDPAALVEALKGISIDSPRGKITIDPRTNNVVQNYYVGKNVWDGKQIKVKVISTLERVTMPASPPS